MNRILALFILAAAIACGDTPVLKDIEDVVTNDIESSSEEANEPIVVSDEPFFEEPEIVLPRISNYLWKPISEGDGKLVILFSAPGTVDCFVRFDGEDVPQTNRGPSNGRDYTIRFPLTGCEYGIVVVTWHCSLDGLEYFDMKHVYADISDTPMSDVSGGCERRQF